MFIYTPFFNSVIFTFKTGIMAVVCSECTVAAGAVVNYCFVNLALWGSLLAAFLYWSVGHPFSFRQLKVTGRIRYAHITCILLSLIIPLPSAFAPLIDGSVFTTSLVLPCLALNADYVYSTVILPINILLGIQVVLLVLIIWILFKVRGTVHGGLSGMEKASAPSCGVREFHKLTTC